MESPALALQGLKDVWRINYKDHLRKLSVVQWLRHGTSTTGDMDLIPGWRTKILYPVSHRIQDPTGSHMDPTSHICTVWPQIKK